MRDTTERSEALEAGSIRLVGTSVERIIATVTQLLTDEQAHRAMQVDKNPFGDGQAGAADC